MEEFKDIYPKDVDVFNALCEQKDLEYSKKIGKNLSDNLKKLNKSSDYSKLKVFSEELIYLNYQYQKRLQKIKKKIVKDRIDFKDSQAMSGMLTGAGPGWCIDYCDELIKWIEENMENI